MQAEAEDQGASEGSPGHLGRYRLLSRLGEGGMGAIHLAVTAGVGEFQKIAVIKELKPELSSNGEFVGMFLREMKLAGRLSHPNIVQTIEAGQVGDRYFMSMEFLDGQTFSKLLARASEKSKISLRLRLQILCDVLAGLHYAHELCEYDGTPLSVVHCDVSFGNVFITYEGQVKLVDFGVARVAETLGPRAGFQGKIRYAAPEQLTGEPVDRRADIYSAGIMLWESLTLRRFTAGLNSDRAIVDARLKGPERSIRAVMPQVDLELALICDRALKRNPGDRFSTAEEFRLALSDYLSGIGPRIDASEISRLMTAEFSEERSEIHNLISKRLRDPAEISVSVSVPKVAGYDDVTTVADLSTLIESMSSVRSLPATAANSPADPPLLGPRGRLWVIGGALGAGTLTTILFTMKMLLSPQPTEEPGRVQLPTTGQVAPVTPGALTIDTRGQKEPPLGPGLTARPPEKAPTGERSTDNASAPRQRSKGPPAAAPEASDGGPTPKANFPPPERAPATFGQDMAPRPKSERSGIDSSNPFK